MSKSRSPAEIKGDIDALVSSEKKNPGKLGALRREYIEALESEVSALRAKSEGVSVSSASLEPTDVSVGWVDDATSGLVSERALVADVIARFAAEAKPDRTPKFLYNAVRAGIRTLRIIGDAAGLERDSNGLELPAYSTLGLTADGYPIKEKPAPSPAKVVAFETEAQKTIREAQEAALDGDVDEKEMDKARRVAEALAAVGDTTWKTSEQGAAELASVGMGGGSAKVKGI